MGTHPPAHSLSASRPARTYPAPIDTVDDSNGQTVHNIQPTAETPLLQERPRKPTQWSRALSPALVYVAAMALITFLLAKEGLSKCPADPATCARMRDEWAWEIMGHAEVRGLYSPRAEVVAPETARGVFIAGEQLVNRVEEEERQQWGGEDRVRAGEDGPPNGARMHGMVVADVLRDDVSQDMRRDDARDPESKEFSAPFIVQKCPGASNVKEDRRVLRSIRPGRMSAGPSSCLKDLSQQRSRTALLRRNSGIDRNSLTSAANAFTVPSGSRQSWDVRASEARNSVRVSLLQVLCIWFVLVPDLPSISGRRGRLT